MILHTQLPEYELKTRRSEAGLEVFDDFRKKYVSFTPEEFVRQRFLLFLVHEKKYPKSLISVEKSLKVNGLDKRADALVYDAAGRVRMVVECKAPSVTLSQDVFDQIVRYNMVYKSDYLLITNGLSHACVRMNYAENSYNYLVEIPKFSELL